MKISVLIAFGIVLVLNIFLFRVLRKKAKTALENEICCYPVSVSALICFLYSIVLIMLGYEAANSAIWSVFGGVSLAAFLALFILFFFWVAINSIVYDENGFYSRDFWGRTQEFLYSDVTGFNNKGVEYVIRCGKKSVSYFSNSNAAKEFYEIVKEKYFEQTGKTVPEKPEDIFRGNLKNPKEQGIAMIILLVLGTGLLFAPIFLPSLLSPPDESELFSKELTFSSFETIKEKTTKHLYLYSDNEEYAYSTKSERFISDINRLMEKCDGETVFSVLYKPKIFFRNANVVYGISDESGFVYYSPENLDRTEDLEELSVMSVYFGAILIGFSGFLFYAARNPEKFSKKLLEFIFGDEISA